LRNREALTNLLHQIYDPASPNYHHYLTPEQCAEQFGPTKQDYEAVKAFARANGLKVTTEHPNRLLLDVNGSTADVERALHVKLQTYQHPKEKRTFYAPDVEPLLDLAVPVCASGVWTITRGRAHGSAPRRLPWRKTHGRMSDRGRLALIWGAILGRPMRRASH